MFRVPPPLPADAPLSAFSEGRALQHLRVLTKDIGQRQVTTPGLRLAADYLHRVCSDLAASAAGRRDISITVDRELVSGSVAMEFLGSNFTNAYEHLENIICYIAPTLPPGAPERKALMVVAHHDSAIATTGAAGMKRIVAGS